MVYLTLYNNLWIKIDVSEVECLELIKDHFSYYIENYYFMPRYKAGVWDGKIYLFDFKNRLLPYGFLFDLIKLLKKNNYEIKASDEVKNLYGDKLENYTINYDLKFTPRYYQKDIIESCLKHKKGIFVSPTASGKSLSISYLIKILQESNKIKRSLIIVPTQSLILQFFDDLIDYGMDENLIGKFYAEEKDWDKPILISTWQSLNYDNEKIRQNEVKELKKKIRAKNTKKEDKKKHQARLNKITSNEYIERVNELMSYKKNLLEEIDCVIVDECQTVQSQEVSNLMKKIKNALLRFGCTGTLPDSKLNIKQICSFIGPVIKQYTVKELTKAEFLNKCIVKLYNIKYNKSVKGTYSEVKDTVFENEFRLSIISNYIESIENDNCLILVDKIEKEGKVLEHYLKETFPDKKVKFIYGGIKANEREEWRKRCINEDNVILISIYSLFQQGINIPNLSHIILGASSKSKIRVLQTIGRSLRISTDKGISYIVDLIDNVKYLKTHAKERLKYYNNEGFEIEEETFKE